jgi:hypothetical protein
MYPWQSATPGTRVKGVGSLAAMVSMLKLREKGYVAGTGRAYG